jgi:hypothetical protein
LVHKASSAKHARLLHHDVRRRDTAAGENRELAATGDGRARLITLTLVLGALEGRHSQGREARRGSNDQPKPRATEYLTFLAANGYPLAPIEQVLTGQRAPATPGTTTWHTTRDTRALGSRSRRRRPPTERSTMRRRRQRRWWRLDLPGTSYERRHECVALVHRNQAATQTHVTSIRTTARPANTRLRPRNRLMAKSFTRRGYPHGGQPHADIINNRQMCIDAVDIRDKPKICPSKDLEWETSSHPPNSSVMQTITVDTKPACPPCRKSACPRTRRLGLRDHLHHRGGRSPRLRDELRTTASAGRDDR